MTVHLVQAMLRTNPNVSEANYYQVDVGHPKPEYTIRQALVAPKDKKLTDKKQGVVNK